MSRIKKIKQRLESTMPYETLGAWYHEDIPFLLHKIEVTLKKCPNGGNDGYISPRPCQEQEYTIQTLKEKLSKLILKMEDSFTAHLLQENDFHRRKIDNLNSEIRELRKKSESIVTCGECKFKKTQRCPQSQPITSDKHPFSFSGWGTPSDDYYCASGERRE